MNDFTQSYMEKKSDKLFNVVLENLSTIILSEAEATFSQSVHFETMEACIAQIQQNHDVNINLMKLQKAINAEFKTNCLKVFITDNKVKSYFFGAHIIPTEKECYKLAENVIKIKENVKFDVCSEFVIELDSKLIYDLDATPEEIVAVLLHEIGHKVFYTKNKVNMKAKFIECLASNGLLTVVSFITRISMFKFLLFTLILNFFSSCFSNVLSLKEEIDADSFAIRYGYGKDLYSVIEKLTKYSKLFGGFGFARNKKKEDDAIASWCVKSMAEFQLRKISIKKDLETMLKSEQNPEVRKIINSQIRALEGTTRRTKGLGSINISMFSSQPVSESFSSFAEMNAKGISYLELDELDVEIDRIRDHEDKLYVISRIHKNLADNGKFIKEKEKELSKKKLSDAQIKDNIEMKDLLAYRSKLLDLLRKCRAVKPREKHHHFIVGYPLGYEG